MTSPLISRARAAFARQPDPQSPPLDVQALQTLTEQQMKKPQASEQEQALVLHDAACKCMEAADLTAATSFYKMIGEKSLSPDLKVQFLLARSRYHIYKRDYSAARTDVEQARQQKGLSFDTESQTKIYYALLCLLSDSAFETPETAYSGSQVASFAHGAPESLQNASNLLISAISTFSAEEIVGFHDFATIAFALACGFLERKQLRRLCDEQMDAFSECAHPVMRLAQVLLNCEWTAFGEALEELRAFISQDFFLHTFYEQIIEKITAQAYQQYLQAFLAAQVDKMAADFRTDADSISRQLEYLIFKGDVKAKIDAVEHIIRKCDDKQTDRLWDKFENECGTLVAAIESMQRGK